MLFFNAPSKSRWHYHLHYSNHPSCALISRAFRHAREHKTLFARLKADIMPTSGCLLMGQKWFQKAQHATVILWLNPKSHYGIVECHFRGSKIIKIRLSGGGPIQKVWRPQFWFDVIGPSQNWPHDDSRPAGRASMRRGRARISFYLNFHHILVIP